MGVLCLVTWCVAISGRHAPSYTGYKAKINIKENGWSNLDCINLSRYRGKFCYWVENKSDLWSYEKADVFRGKAFPSQISN
jgi:hypothetical protein